MSIAPGEGKTPTNILEEVDWDIKTFPGLHPDGNNSLHTVRAVNLAAQNYFVQCLMNKDRRFAQNAAYVFAAAAFIERKQIQRNTGITEKDSVAKFADIFISCSLKNSLLETLSITCAVHNFK